MGVVDLTGPVLEVAPQLLGCKLVTAFEGRATAVVIDEVEAYGGEDDPASHAARGVRPKNRSMFGHAGTLYVYRSYGIHWCANISTGPAGLGAAVLLRGGVPAEGREVMVERRGRDTNLANGPGKLCQALGINGDHDGSDVASGPVQLLAGDGPHDYRQTPRIGISKATQRPWRFLALDQ